MAKTSSVLCVMLVTILPIVVSSRAQTEQTGEGIYPLRQATEVRLPRVTFLERAPRIDGVLDDQLTDLPVGRFVLAEVDGRGPELAGTTRAQVEASEPSYRLAYGADFFYLYAEAPGDELHFRDRAYQNGDGFHLLLAETRPDGAPTDEFYVLACSAVKDSSLDWTRHVFWYYNVGTIFKETSEDTRLEFTAGDGRIRFELYLPWRDVHPHHPWLSAGLGFNLRFVEAVGEGARYKYIVLDDELGAESSLRKYLRLEFAQPHVEGASQTFVLPDRGNLAAGEPLTGTAVTAAAEPGTQTVELDLRAEGDRETRKTGASFACGAGLSRHSFSIDTAGLEPGGYRLEWRAGEGRGSGSAGLTIRPSVDLGALATRVEACGAHLEAGSLSTLQFTIDYVADLLAAVRPYETCSWANGAVTRLTELVETAEGGGDPVAERTGMFRRAYRSQVDGTLQPYVVVLPDELDRGRRYPLVVFLHGSASDESNVVEFRDLIPDGCIGLAPRGRGPSNLFCFDFAQDDIREAIDDVIANYPIDEDRIVLSGFSMGGYGVYRTFAWAPERFRALVVLSGVPFGFLEDRPGEPGCVPVIDFRQPGQVDRFAGMPVFIFHGEQDRNCPFETTREFVASLQQAGAKVAFVSEADAGHARPSDPTFARYREWLRVVLEE